MDTAKLQKWFNEAYQGLKAQEFKKSLAPNGACDFRGQNGSKCAVGHLVTDEDLQKVNNGGYAYPDMVREYLTKDKDENQFLVGIMLAHDQSFDGVDMKESLERFAKRYDLTVPQ